MRPIFEFNNYRAYLQELVGNPGSRTGARSSMAKAMTCQLTYFSQVLKGRAHLSLEQATKLSRHLNLTKEETRFFITLLQKERAGTPELKNIFEEQLGEILADRLVIKKRLGTSGTVPEKLKPIYYSSWHFAAVHMALSIPTLRSKEAIAEYFHIPRKRVAEVLEFLTAAGLAVNSGGQLQMGPKHVRLGRENPLIYKHHSNWRNKAIESLELEEADDLHYSAVVTLSKSDAKLIKEKILQALEENLAVIRASNEEEVVCYNVDFFKLKRTTN